MGDLLASARADIRVIGMNFTMMFGWRVSIPSRSESCIRFMVCVFNLFDLFFCYISRYIPTVLLVSQISVSNFICSILCVSYFFSPLFGYVIS